MITLAELYSKAAANLTGETVTVQFREPVFTGCLGAAGRTEHGRAVIQLSPRLQGLKLVRVFLHECSHVRLHDLPAAKCIRYPSGSFTKKTENQVEENQADELAGVWWDYAERNHERYSAFVRTKESQMVRCLWDWEDETK